MPFDLNRQYIAVLSFITNQKQSFETSGQQTSSPLAAYGDWLLRWDNHQHILTSLNDPQYTYCAPLFYVPGK